MIILVNVVLDLVNVVFSLFSTFVVVQCVIETKKGLVIL